jgi:hypothetical protein
VQGFASKLNPRGGSEVCFVTGLSTEPAWRQRQAGFLMRKLEIVTLPAAATALRTRLFWLVVSTTENALRFLVMYICLMKNYFLRRGHVSRGQLTINSGISQRNFAKDMQAGAG